MIVTLRQQTSTLAHGCADQDSERRRSDEDSEAVAAVREALGRSGFRRADRDRPQGVREGEARGRPVMILGAYRPPLVRSDPGRTIDPDRTSLRRRSPQRCHLCGAHPRGRHHERCADPDSPRGDPCGWVPFGSQTESGESASFPVPASSRFLERHISRSRFGGHRQSYPIVHARGKTRRCARQLRLASQPLKARPICATPGNRSPAR